MSKKRAESLSIEHPWDNNDHLIWLGSTVAFSRNIAKYKFPNKLEDVRQKQVLSLIAKHFEGAPHLMNPRLLKAQELTPTNKEYLAEHYLALHSYQQAHSGEGFIIDESGLFISTINMEDHLHIQLLETQSELESCWSKLVQIETHLGKNLPYSYSSRFGFLTANPAKTGTALQAKVFLQLSGLIHTDRINAVIQQYLEEGIHITGIQGSPKEVIGDLIVVQNAFSVGMTEETIISHLRSFCTKLHVEEKSMRAQIKETGNPKVKDKVSRAFAILVHSYQLDAIESLNALSLLKLGVQLDWISGVTNQQLNQLLFNCRRAHLLSQFEEDVTQEEISHKRAEYIHRTLQGITLKI